MFGPAGRRHQHQFDVALAQIQWPGGGINSIVTVWRCISNGSGGGAFNDGGGGF